MKALIIIAHGSKKNLSNKEFTKLVKSVSKQNESYDMTIAAFLELCEPSIHEATQEAIEKGATEIYYYPYFLNSGKHIQIDIPNILEDLRITYLDCELVQLPHFGKSEKIKEIILEDIKLDK